MPNAARSSATNVSKVLQMKLAVGLTGSILVFFWTTKVGAMGDGRELVPMPSVMQEHMLSNMRDHLAALSDILAKLASNELDEAADLAESRLGLSSLDKHGASHMAKVMPEEMRRIGTSMHRAASNFALKAQEGEAMAAYGALSEVTAACVACHSVYRVR